MSKRTHGEGWGWNGDICAAWGVAITLGSDEEKEQRARLLAAAPDLLEALRALVARKFSYYGGFVVDCNITEEEVSNARAAIAKAEGKS